MTEYVVLHYIDHEWTWKAISDNQDLSPNSYLARSSGEAIKQALNGDTLGGIYVAVPARSWKPVTVEVETKTALRFS